MTEYSRIAKGNFTAASGVLSAAVVLPFQPDFVEVWNYTNIKTAAANVVTRAWWDAKLFDGSNNPTMLEIYNNASAVVFDTIQTNGISAFSAGLSQQFGATQQIIGITKATQAVVNVTAHGYNVGDTVVMQGLALATTNNMQLLNTVPFTIVAVSDTSHFTINWDTSGSAYTALSASPAGALVRKVLYPFLYLPQDNVIKSVTIGSSNITIATTMYHNFEPGQEIAFRIPSLWGCIQLNSLPNNAIPGSPVYAYVLSITDNWTFVCAFNGSQPAATPAFTDNFTMTAATLPGLSYPQVLSVGDVNTGGLSLYQAGVGGFLSTSGLYPSPAFPTSTNRVASINGPVVKGAFVNNTNQGFVIGSGVAAVDLSAAVSILTASQANQIYWRAYLSDYSAP